MQLKATWGAFMHLNGCFVSHTIRMMVFHLFAAFCVSLYGMRTIEYSRLNIHVVNKLHHACMGMIWGFYLLDLTIDYLHVKLMHSIMHTIM